MNHTGWSFQSMFYHIIFPSHLPSGLHSSLHCWRLAWRHCFGCRPHPAVRLSCYQHRQRLQLSHRHLHCSRRWCLCLFPNRDGTRQPWRTPPGHHKREPGPGWDLGPRICGPGWPGLQQSRDHSAGGKGPGVGKSPPRRCCQGKLLDHLYWLPSASPVIPELGRRFHHTLLVLPRNPSLAGVQMTRPSASESSPEGHGSELLDITGSRMAESWVCFTCACQMVNCWSVT